MGLQLQELQRAQCAALSLRLLLCQVGQETESGVHSVLEDPSLLDVDRVFADAAANVGHTTAWSTPEQCEMRKRLVAGMFPLLPWIDIQIDSGHDLLSGLSRSDVMPVSCWAVRQSLALLPRYSPQANRVRHLVDCIEDIASVKTQTHAELLVLADSIKASCGIFAQAGLSNYGDQMLERFCNLVANWDELMVVFHGPCADPWWYDARDVAFMSAATCSACGANDSQCRAAFSERVRLQLGLVLQQMICSPAEGTVPSFPSEVAEVMSANKTTVPRLDQLRSFLFVVGEVRRASSGALRTIAGIGFDETSQPIYCVLCHNNGKYVLKRGAKAHVDYSPVLGWDDLLLSKCSG